jgi:hypothetical protein
VTAPPESAEPDLGARPPPDPLTGPRHRPKGPELVSATQNRLASACLSQTPRFGRISLGVDHPREVCGVFGGWAPEPVANLVCYGLYMLQHRGQESAGMAVADGCGLLVYREMGLVSQIFGEATLAALQGHQAIGHTRDATTGSWENAQPAFTTNAAGGGVVVAHNGNLTSTAALVGAPDSAGITPGLARCAPGRQRQRGDGRAAGLGGRPANGGGGRPHRGPPRGSYRDRRPCPDRSRQGAVHDPVYGGLSDPGPGCGGPGRHPPPTATQPSTLPLLNPEPEVAR